MIINLQSVHLTLYELEASQGIVTLKGSEYKPLYWPIRILKIHIVICTMWNLQTSVNFVMLVTENC